MKFFVAALIILALFGVAVAQNPTSNATQVNGAAVPASQTCVGTNASGQLVASSCSGTGSTTWGSLTGTLSSQTDLQSALNAKQNSLTFPLTLANGGTGTTTPGLTAGANIAITGTWPNNTVAVSGLPTFPAGTIVGTTDTQTLTNKSIASSEITGLPSFPAGTIVGTTDTQTLTNKSIAASEVNSGTLAIANGGTGTASPGLVAGSNVTISGSWPNQTIAASGGSGGSTSWGSITGTLSNQSDLNTALSGKQNTLTLPLSTANGGTGTASPGLTAGANINITGTWPNNTVAVSGLPTFPAGTIVGTTDTQTLTNKSIASTEITGLPTFPNGTIVGTTDTQTLTNKSIDASEIATGVLPKANGGTGTATPGLSAGTGISITGTWPNSTISASGSGLSRANPYLTDGTNYFDPMDGMFQVNLPSATTGVALITGSATGNTVGPTTEANGNILVGDTNNSYYFFFGKSATSYIDMSWTQNGGGTQDVVGLWFYDSAKGYIYFVYFTPYTGNSSFYSATYNGTTIGSAASVTSFNAANSVSMHIKLQVTGTNFYVYQVTDGSDYQQVYTSNQTLSSPVQFGYVIRGCTANIKSLKIQ